MNKIKYFLICLLFLLPFKAFADTLPSKYDLRNVDGKSYITPFKDQGNEGLCWDFAATAHLESRVLKEKNKAYDLTATIFSEKQIVYAASYVTTNGKRAYNNYECRIDNGYVGDGGGFACLAEVMLDGLGAVTNDWDIENKSAIENNNAPLDSSIVYNFDNSLYELNSTIEYNSFRTADFSESDRTSILNEIKENIIKYGGGVIGTDVGYNSRGMYGGKDVMVVASGPDSSTMTPQPHDMQVIGWDDDYEYMVCKRDSGFAYPPNDCTNGYVSGKGVWIVKNSWKDVSEDTLNSIVLIAYDTYYGTSFNFIKDISTRTWDNYYQLDSEYIDATSRSLFFKDDEYITDEIIDKIKIKLYDNNHFDIYYSEDGSSNYILIAQIDTNNPLRKTNFEGNRDFIGYYYWDLSSKGYHINNNTKFKVVDGEGAFNYDFRVYTNNVNKNHNLTVKNVTFDKDTHNQSTYSFVLNTSTKNIKDKDVLTYKIKDPNGNYLNNDYYSYNYNNIYANINSSKFDLVSSKFNNGTYLIETYHNNSLLYTSKLVVKDSQTVDITKYTLTYDTNEGSNCTNPTKTVYIGEKWGELCTPTRDNYMFDGWWTEKTGGTKIDADTIPDSDIIAYSHWIAVEEEITNPNTIDYSFLVNLLLLIILGISIISLVIVRKRILKL